jgi:GPH family glycoside/pentoside/hexuronide:cation symporter
MAEAKTKKSFFDNPVLSTKVKSANVKLFPEAALGYLVGPALALFSNALLNGYLNKYYTDVLGLTSWAKAFSIWLPIISVITVVLGNLLVGRLMNKNKTHAGKARPLLLLAIPLIAVAIFLLFFAPYPADNPTAENSMATLIWVAIGYNLYYAISYPFYYVAHSALVNLSTRNSNHRGLLATASNASGLAAVGLACNMVFPLFQSFLFKDGDPVASYNAWRVFMIILIVVSAIGMLIEYYFTRERITEENLALGIPETKANTISMTKQMKVCVSDKYWWFIILFFLLYQLGGQLKNCSCTYYSQWLFADPDSSRVASLNGATYNTTYGGIVNSLINTIGAIPTGVGMLIVWPLANKFGKGKSILYGALLSVIGGVIGIFWGANNVPVAVAAFVIKALGSVPAMYVSLALLSDVLDHQEALHGFRTDGFTMSIYGAIMIGMNGLANGIINGVLSQTGYDATLAVSGQPDAAKTALSWIFFGGEAIAYLAIGIMFLFMNVEKFSKLDQAAITEDQKAKCLANGVSYVEPAVRLANEQKELDEKAEEARKAELKATCEKKGLNFEAEEKKYEDQKAIKDKQAAEKKALAESKKEAKAKEAEAKKAEEENKLTPEEKAAKEAKAKEAAEKKAAYDASLSAEYAQLRSQAKAKDAQRFAA